MSKVGGGGSEKDIKGEGGVFQTFQHTMILFVVCICMRVFMCEKEKRGVKIKLKIQILPRIGIETELDLNSLVAKVFCHRKVWIY